MNSGELYELFRSDVVDEAAPYLWSDMEVFRYMNDAYRQFVRLTGGIADSTSDVTQIPVVAGEPYSEVSSSILRFRQAYVASNGNEIEVINQEDLHKLKRSDYGVNKININDLTQGDIRYMIVGQQRGQVRWVQVPAADDVVQLSVYRLPADTITEGNTTFTFPDIGEEHIEWLLLWMKARAYGKQDAETFDKGREDRYKATFEQYCRDSKAEWERYKHKPRSITYGGI